MCTVKTPERFSFRFKAMGSPCEIQLFARNQEQCQTAFQAAHQEVVRLEQKYSRFLPESVTSKINSYSEPYEWLAIDPETDALLDYADTVYQQSEGLFDITSGKLREIWDFKNHRVPTFEEIADCVKLIGWNKVRRRQAAIQFTQPGMQLDFGGVVKEYAVDCCLTQLRSHGISSAMVDLGGDIGCNGPQPGDKPWSVGIRNPRQPERPMSTILVSQGALATSGDYERFFEKDGQRYCHILNPQTGWPVSGCRSVSVLAPHCVIAGSLSTSAMLLGKEKGLPLLEKTKLPFLLIDQKGQIFSNQSFNSADSVPTSDS